jgi:hypothetical protein
LHIPQTHAPPYSGLTAITCSHFFQPPHLLDDCGNDRTLGQRNSRFQARAKFHLPHSKIIDICSSLKSIDIADDDIR